MPMSCKDRPPARKAEALSEGTAKNHGPCDAVEAIGLSSERSQRAMSGRERERTAAGRADALQSPLQEKPVAIVSHSVQESR
jgi:hypothetical protein